MNYGKEACIKQKSLNFLETYLNNAAPTGYEWEGKRFGWIHLNMLMNL